METIFIKRFIKTKDDLPKVTGLYHVFVKGVNGIRDWTYNLGSDTDDSKDWMDSVDYWLQPVTLAELIKEKLPSEEQIKEIFTTNHYHYEKGHYRRVRLDRIQGAKTIIKWIINKLIE